MASNRLPNTFDQLFTLAEDIADGCHAYEAAIGLKQNTETDVRADLAAARTGAADYDSARTSRTALGIAQTGADANAKAFIGAARKVLAIKLGEIWSESWLTTGFPGQSTAVPDTVQSRQELLFALNTYFLAHPADEVPALNVTAAQALLLGNALSAARSAVNNAATDCGRKKNLRDDAVSALRKRLSGLIAELGQLLDDNDPRWSAFGLNQPGASEVPDAPDAAVLTASGPGTVFVDWPDASRATRYRVFKQVVGVDEKPASVATVTDSNALLTGLPTGKTVKVTVTAANDAGESAPSDTTQIVVA